MILLHVYMRVVIPFVFCNINIAKFVVYVMSYLKCIYYVECLEYIVFCALKFVFYM